MGKIRLKTIGDEATEQEEKQKADIKRAEKKAREEANEPTEEKEESAEETNPQTETPEVKTEAKKEEKTKKSKFAKAQNRSANYLEKALLVDKTKTYSLSDALELLKKIKMTKFDETVELHVNTTETGISGMVKLPHGTGKEVRVAIADDAIIAEVEKGKINFDVLIAEPAMMPKLAKVARVLGPRGLMPNPKNGTVSADPAEAAKKFQGGQIGFKTESKNPIIHVSVGKTSFTNDQLSENIKTMLTAIKRAKTVKVVLKSTMSPGIRIQA